MPVSRFALAVVCASLLPVTPAQACRVMRSPEQRIADVRAKNPEIRVALVRITDAQSRPFPMSAALHKRWPKDYQDPWRAVGTVERLLTGQWSPELVMFDRGMGSAACDDGTPKPRKGDKWVVYLNGDLGDAAVLETYPLAVAERADPTLRGLLSAKH